MQLKQLANISMALAAASCAALGQQAEAGTLLDDWQFNSAILLYNETDRVSAGEGILTARGDFGDDKYLNLGLVVDALTGASATGAVAQPYVQSFTRPSGRGSYDVAAGVTPMDDTFHDTRVQLDASWEQPIAANWRASGGGHLSKEYDYLSMGLNGSLARDFNQKNTTVSLGLGYSHDTISPEGGIAAAFAPMLLRSDYADDSSYQAAFDATRDRADDTKDTLDVLLGLTQVINRNWLMQLNYSFSLADGYMTDPFKLVSVINANGEVQQNLYESRPDQRTKHSLYWQNKLHVRGSYLDASYRYMWDDWELSSHTADLKWRLPMTDRWYIEPQFRYYQQSAAEFYQPFILQAEPLPQYVSADYRIGKMNTYTLGAKFGTKLAQGNELSFRIALYQQNPQNDGVAAPGVLANVELYEKVTAVMAQVSYSF
ncbi:MAG: hypothetical protein CML20_02520 [Rheinheimera sp.]|uniref:DUF3570 domain-containing protein n=1 Tax=Arsukibacterium sp. UBA3155 TaxID=1946058 RepID=UPI000C92DE5A|nr:DUF3570 domain-containing protein [Arsukibacterium sp. UBA3155]MAD73673.1 hypothetical protein [Rheinheimera sp.]|tara:strand:+ start:239146 stop:240435 length:1290 start_codon:yes stop_codon:yes gene_type:complete